MRVTEGGPEFFPKMGTLNFRTFGAISYCMGQGGEDQNLCKGVFFHEGEDQNLFA